MLFKFAIVSSLIISLFWPPKQPDPSLVFVGSTPGDGDIRSILSIPPDARIDFMRWKLELHGSGAFSLELAFGESRPNTLGFMDTVWRSYEGNYEVEKGDKLIYHLKGNGIKNELMLAKINENIFHILTNLRELMVGNGGWSYTLNAAKPVPITSKLTSFSLPVLDTARQLVFDGRTPCKEFAVDHGVKENPDCFKVKWRVMLNRDPQTLEPTIYSTRRIVYDLADNTGTWAIKKLSDRTFVIQLNPDQPGRSISLLMVDKNILYFLDKNGQPYTGNADFSFALNRQ